MCAGAELGSVGPGPGDPREDRAPGEILSRGAGQGRDAEGAEPGL